MNTEEITIRVDAETAAAYRAADKQGRLRASILLKLGLKPAAADERRLTQVFEDINARMRARGMNETAAEVLLKDLEEFS